MLHFRFDGIARRLSKAVKSFLSQQQEHTESDTLGIIEADFEHDKYRDKLESRDPNMNSYGTFADDAELLQFQAVKEEIEKTLHKSCAKQLDCCVDISSEQLNHVTQDVLRMAQTEPCGLRGAIIFIILERKKTSQKLATIVGDSSTTPTFEVYVTLREDTSRWKALKKAYLTLKGCLLNNAWRQAPIILCTGFQLEKKRLYRTNFVQN